MKCPACQVENKENANNCKKCGTSLIVLWSPTWQWHGRALAIIYVSLIFVYFLLNFLLKPYLREIPPEVTPWLKKAGKMHQ